ncbi:MAG TPA: ferrous iron transport protein B, partial [Chitinolyticbacter sp.]|nr:ferrous iron transport protein B [Chitinolyticbacter sp.]
VTVERKSGVLRHEGVQVEIIDLPGLYTLNAAGEGAADERVARDFIREGGADLVVNIVDAANLERNLYLTTQLLELGVPLMLVLNMVDVATAAGVEIDSDALARQLGCPVLAISAARRHGIRELKAAVVLGTAAAPRIALDLPASVRAGITALAGLLPEAGEHAAYTALQLLEGDSLAEHDHPALLPQVAKVQARIAAADDVDADILIADARYRFAGEACRTARRVLGQASRSATERIDRVVLNRWLGLPVFLGVMYLMFLFTIDVGSAFIDVFDQGFGALLVDGPASVLASWNAPAWLIVLQRGAGSGIQTVATFVPVIASLYLILSALEDSGYMARAAFVMDRAMRALGLPGKAFVPLLIGFGCNVPAIMATRTLENRRDRILTAMMAPFMSCGARLPVYTLFAAAFFPASGQNVVFALYLVGIACAVATAWLLRRSLLPGDGTPLVMELPLYHLPRPMVIVRRAMQRLRDFVAGAGRIIVPMVMVLTLLNTLGADGSLGHEDSEQSVLAAVGQTIAPAFAPLGVDAGNWQAAVGLFTGVLAKEAVVGTLNALYTPESASEEEFALGVRLQAAWQTVPDNLAGLVDKLADPLGLSVGDLTNQAQAASALEASVSTFTAMQARFDGGVGAFAYLLLILLYTPCLAALGAIRVELGMRWSLFAAVWTFAVGYGVASSYYQLASFGVMAWQGWLAVGLCMGGCAALIAMPRLIRLPRTMEA